MSREKKREQEITHDDQMMTVEMIVTEGADGMVTIETWAHPSNEPAKNNTLTHPFAVKKAAFSRFN